MKKFLRNTILLIVIAVVAFIYYYITLPAFNIHSAGFWFFIMAAIVAIIAIYLYRKIWKKDGFSKDSLNYWEIKKLVPVKVLGGILLIIIAIYFIGNILSSPFINADKYQSLLTVEDRVFTEDIKEADFSTVPILDKDSAALLANRKMGSIIEMVSQFEVGTDYTQINYNDRPVRVTPLVYASTIKWLTNQDEGITAYMRIDMTTQETECVQLEEGIKYSKSEYFNRNIYRHLRFNYPTYIFADQIFFEIDDDGVPYWVCPVKKFNVGLFGGQTIDKVILCNAITGECINYNVEDVPKWIDKVYSAEMLISLYDYSGTLIHGYWNSVLGQKDCLQSTNGYNYLALEDDVWVYTGITSVSGDQSNVGFVLMNQRTMETRLYHVEGAIEDSAMSSAEGQVQHLGYQATFPMLININGEPTYYLALKDAAGLVKMYAMINVQKYQLVAIGDTVKECLKQYGELMETNGMSVNSAEDIKEGKGVVSDIASVVIEGTTHYYFYLTGEDLVYDVDLTNDELLSVIKCQAGDTIEFTYTEDVILNKVLTLVVKENIDKTNKTE